MPSKRRTKTFAKMSDEEVRLAKMWHAEDERSTGEIAHLLRRDRSTISRHVMKDHVKQKQGRPGALSDSQKDLLVTTLEDMIKKAKGEYRVTADMLRKRMRLKVSTRRVLEALHSRGVRFHVMRQKPLLAEDDVRARFDFA